MKIFSTNGNKMVKQILQVNITWLKNPNWQKSDQMAICQLDQGVELGSIEKVVVMKIHETSPNS